MKYKKDRDFFRKVIKRRRNRDRIVLNIYTIACALPSPLYPRFVEDESIEHSINAKLDKCKRKSINITPFSTEINNILRKVIHTVKEHNLASVYDMYKFNEYFKGLNFK